LPALGGHAVEHAAAEPVEVGVAAAIEGDELAVELNCRRQRFELGPRHVPAAPAPRAQAVVRVDEAAEPG
jgi:hypothetical protein